MPTATSKDGTAIAYEKTGQGPAIILVNGALAHREFYGEKDLAAMLAPEFTVIWFDRRGRGDSTDTKPYTAEKEIEDIEALVEVVGGQAYLYGCSSGAALALLAAAMLGPEKITKLALYEPPYNADAAGFAEGKNKVNGLLAAGKSGDAVAAFLEIAGTPAEELENMKQSPDWKEMERLCPTLSYDYAVLGDGAIPPELAKNISVPTLVMNGEKGIDPSHATADALGKIIPGLSRKTLKDQPHVVAPEALAPVLIDFFV